MLIVFYRTLDSSKKTCRIKRGIKNAWKDDNVKIKFVYDDDEYEGVKKVAGYVCKGIGMGSEIEDSLRRANKGEATEEDIKKLWAHYFIMKLNYRRWSASQDLSSSNDSLDNIYNKSGKSATNDEKGRKIAHIPIPYSMIKSGKIKLEGGIVKSGSPEYKYANDLLKERQKNNEASSLAMEALKDIDESYFF